MTLLPWSQLNGRLVSHMRSLRIRTSHRNLIALVVAFWGGAAVMDWHELDSVGGWLSIVLVLFIASYVLLATTGGTGSRQRVRRRSGPLMIALVAAIEGATISALWYRLTLEAWLNLGLAFFASSYLLLAILDGLWRSLQRWRQVNGRAAAAPHPSPVGTDNTARRAAQTGSALRLGSYLRRWSVPSLLALVVAVEILAHAGPRSPHVTGLQPTRSPGAFTHAEGYISFLGGVPVYLEAQNEVVPLAMAFSGEVASGQNLGGPNDDRAGYAYLLALAASVLSYYPAGLLINGLFWWLASMAVWSLGRTFFGNGPRAIAAALLTATSQGLTFWSATPMSYVVGLAWFAILLAVATRWRIAGWGGAAVRHRLAFGWLVGVTGLFYVVPQVALGWMGMFVLRRAAWWGILFAAAMAVALLRVWQVAGKMGGLAFDPRVVASLGYVGGQPTLANWLEFWAQVPQPLLTDLSRYQLIGALVGGFYYPLLFASLVGIIVARPRRQQWYAAVLVAGLGAGVIASQIHTISSTSRYIYWAYPALYLAAAEGSWFLGRRVGEAVMRWRSWNAAGGWPTGIARGALAALVLFQLAVSLADVFGQYHFVVLLTWAPGLRW